MLNDKLELNNELSDTFLQSGIVHEKAAKFTDFLDNLSLACEICNRALEPYKLPHDISESELRKEIEETYVQIQKFFEE